MIDPQQPSHHLPTRLNAPQLFIRWQTDRERQTCTESTGRRRVKEGEWGPLIVDCKESQGDERMREREMRGRNRGELWTCRRGTRGEKRQWVTLATLQRSRDAGTHILVESTHVYGFTCLQYEHQVEKTMNVLDRVDSEHSHGFLPACAFASV